MLSPEPGLSDTEFAVALERLAVFEPHPLVAVGVSGGADSLALTLLADRWARRRGGEVCALSVDHQLRPESGAEIAVLGRWLRGCGIRHEILVWAGDKPSSGLQEAARSARYTLLTGWCRQHGCLHLLLAHHCEDQIETHLIRRRADSGAAGLAGMTAIRELADLRVLRPLLGFAKSRLVARLAIEEQPFIDDPSNRDPHFERARLRRAGAVSDAAANAARLDEIRILGQRRAERDTARNRRLVRAVALHPAGFAVVDPERLLAPPRDLAERALAAVVCTIGNSRYPPRRERLTRALVRLRAGIGGDGGGPTLGGCHFLFWRGRVLVVREPARAEAPVHLVPGTRVLWDRRFVAAVPAEAARSLTLGCLGRDGVAELDRRAGRPRKPALPRLIWPTLPAFRDEVGLFAVPHAGFRRDDSMTAAQLCFRPEAALTDAGFTVV